MTNSVILSNNDDDDDDDFPLCSCGLCMYSRQIINIVPNNIIFRNPISLFIIIFILPCFIFGKLLLYFIV